MDTLQETARVVTSKPVQRAVVNTFINTALLISTAVTLFCLAAFASALFFQNFVPDQFVTTPIHLQYGAGLNPHGIVSLATPPMKAQQDYDISVTLSMPRSPVNVERGNFMVSLHLLDSDANDRLGTKPRKFTEGRMDLGHHKVVFSSRRPALVPYVDPIVSVASRVAFLAYHILVPSSQTQKMTVQLAEHVAFAKTSAIPSSAYVEIEAGQDIQIYDAALTLTAQLRGLRWLMFHYRLPTYVAFTFLFWTCEVFFMSAAWILWNSLMSSGDTGKGKRRGGRNDDEDDEDEEDEDGDELSDHPHNFPTYGRQPPLKYEPGVKKEESEGHERLLADIPVGGAEADDEEELDDEDEEASWQKDSGIGTSYSEEGSASVRKRPSKNVMG